MKCAVHTEVDASGFCRNCGKALCAECQRDVRGILYCEPCLATLVTKPQVAAPGPGNPALAAVLGCIPGLGAVYNDQYIKAAVHVMIFAGLIAILDRVRGGAEPFFALLMSAFVIYMPIDAYRTAKARMQRLPLPDIFGGAAEKHHLGPIFLIIFGSLILLSNLQLVDLGQIADFWPVLLIGMGIWLLRRRMQPAAPPEGPSHE